MAMWVLGAVLTGMSQNYGSLMFARVFMGAGAPHHAQISAQPCMLIPWQACT